MPFATRKPKSDPSQDKPALKRQKIAGDMADVDVHMHEAVVYDANKNSNLKGRRRFKADFSDLRDACATGLMFHDLRLKNVRPGDDDGSMEIVIEKPSGEYVLAVNFLVSDTSDYPGSHSLFVYSPDTDIPAKLGRIVEELPEESPKPLGKLLEELMGSVARVVSSAPPKPVIHEISDDDDEQSSAADYDAFEDYDDIAAAPVEASSVMEKLQENFVDIVATEYRPGFIRLGGNDFVVSVSLPVVTLAESIPPRALMAWDRRLLSSPQHLTLLISGFHGVYPVLENDVTYTPAAQRLGVNLTFKVGLSPKYKPSNEQVQEVVRKHGLILEDAEDELRKQAELAQQQRLHEFDFDEDEQMLDITEQPQEVEEPPIDRGRFDRFSLSSSLESLMDQSFLKIVALRRKFALGWAGAELLHSEIEKIQRKEEDVLNMKAKEIRQADADERKLGGTTVLPHDPLVGLRDHEPFNLPLTAFCYLIRRLSLCTRYCIVCHNKLDLDYEALKPYVCDNKLCSYQYYTYNRGPSLEYEIIHNPHTVDLLVSLAYVSASDGAMDEPLPVGLGLRVHLPTNVTANFDPPSQPAYGFINSGMPPAPIVPAATPPSPQKTATIGEDGMCDFDDLTLPQMRAVIARLISTLPSVDDMKRHLERKVKAGKSKPKLKEINPTILPAAWSILRWCVASCTAHIEAIDSSDERIPNLDGNWRQFRLTVGAPDAEAKFKAAVDDARVKDKNASQFPVIYAFHGSPLKNWHSIIRHGLWYRTVAHGRAFGNGVYLARDSATSMGYYASSARSSWSKTLINPTNCMALTEVVNLPSEFVSSNPHYVIKDTHWIMCRYLLVKGNVEVTDSSATPLQAANGTKPASKRKIPFVKLDPKHQTSVNNKCIEIPDPNFQVDSLLDARKADFIHDDPDEEDMAVFQLEQPKTTKSQPDVYDIDDDDDYRAPTKAPSTSKGPVTRPKDDWKHNPDYVNPIVENLMLPPFQSTPSASISIQREMKAMLKEQEQAASLRDLGWYMPPEFIGDNLYQWIVEMHSLDPALPIAKDLKKQKLNSIIFEIRFPPAFPNSPPFFRILSPRFLPFIQGGGGHVTGGGSICMDLLTSDGWLPSYSISAVLMQIRLAISNLEPRPARLAANWNQPYGVQESLAGYKRAAATHGWNLPPGLDRLVR